MSIIVNALKSSNSWQGVNQFLFIMKLTAVFLLVGCLHLSAASYSQTITLEAKESTLKDVFNAIQRQTDYNVVYNVRFLRHTKPVNISVKQMPLEAFLARVLDNQALTYDIREKTILIGQAKEKKAAALMNGEREMRQERQITGRVTDESDVPLEGVTVALKGTESRVITDVNGYFRLNVTGGSSVLVFTMVGFDDIEHAIGGQNVVNISMKAVVSDLDEVVVVGYGTQKKINVTGSVSSISAKDLANRPITNSTQALQGVTGVYVNQAGGQPGKDGATLRIRGQGTFNNNNPLVLVDGIEFPLSDINPNDIENISVLKDAASASIYGNRAANGVILVTTKSGSAGETAINYNNYVGVQAPTYLPETVKDPVRFMELRNQAGYNAGKMQPFYSVEDIDEYRNGTDPYVYPRNDWIDIMFNNALIQEHNLRISGGTDKLGFSVSGGYLDQEGVLMGTGGGRFSVRSGLTYRYKEWLKLGTDLSVIQRNSNEPATTAGTMMEMVFKAQGFHPTYLEDGRYADTWIRSPGHNVYRHPLVWANEGFFNTKRLNGILNFSAEVTLPFGITYNAKIGFSKFSTFEERFVPDIFMYQVKTLAEQRVDYYTPNKNRHAYKNQADGINTTLYNTLNYESSFAGQHHLKVLLGSSFEKFEDRFFNSLIEGFLGNSLTELNAGSINPQVGGTSNMNVLIGTFGRVNYDYASKWFYDDLYG
ncbi:SusC/RagA family TonB-linked outer membrane protein [Parapedobacter soli]|uniref:SusC/RagA family TonB-linked outer membrane protein n=1 Tax=Parapedobacter soli TaxID=416955 RepID=UPI0021C8C7F5|nr:SusC/RagA family TonB-linked outer membrane protein [Parapedobacter soli]